MAQLFSNAARSLLMAGISAVDTSITVDLAKADLFPVADTGTDPVPTIGKDWFKVVLQDNTGAIEIIYVRTRTAGSASMTNCLRGQDGTTAIAFLAGSIVGLRHTAADLADATSFATGASAFWKALVGWTTAALSRTALGASAVGDAVFIAADQAAARTAINAQVAGSYQPAGSYAASGDVTASGLTLATARMLGRSTAGTGAVEEIATGNGLSLAGGVLKVPDQGITPALLERPFTMGTPVVVSGSPTAVDWTPPAWATRIDVDVYRLSGSGVSPLSLRLGTGGTAKTTGYAGATSLLSSGTNPTVSTLSAGFSLISVTGGTDFFSGKFSLTLVDSASNTWLCSASFGMLNTVREQRINGDVSLSGALNLVRITTEGGTDTIDNGVILRPSYWG